MLFPTQSPRNTANNSMFPNRSLNNSNPTSSNNILQNLFKNQSTAGLVNKGVGGLSNTLNNVQQVLKMVETTTPLVQEYGPMVKNLPAMYKMMKAFKDIESTDDNKEIKKDQTEEEDITGNKENTIDDKEDFNLKKDSGESIPKLFI